MFMGVTRPSSDSPPSFVFNPEGAVFYRLDLSALIPHTDPRDIGRALAVLSGPVGTRSVIQGTGHQEIAVHDRRFKTLGTIHVDLERNPTGLIGSASDDSGLVRLTDKIFAAEGGAILFKRNRGHARG